jgi:hypothetical protein
MGILKMSRSLLSISEIKELCELLRKVFSYITKLKGDKIEYPLADKIKYPQLPSILSESLMIHLLKRKIIASELSGFDFNFGGRIADILATKDGNIKRIEVKSTAKSAFEYFGEKDIISDYIIWVHFAEFFLNSRNAPITIFTIRNPARFFQKPIKITLSKMRQIAIGADLEEKQIDIDSL